MILLVLCLSFINAKKLRDLYPEIKANAKGWEVADPDDVPYVNFTLEEIAKAFPNNLGLFPRRSSYPKEEPAGRLRNVSLPLEFDARQKWGKCIHPVRNQQLRCGSCYAHGTTEVLSDRYCIHSNGEIDVVLSPQDMVSCGLHLCNGCGGCVYPYQWLYLEYHGVVVEECFPYFAQVTNCTLNTGNCLVEKVAYKKYYAQPLSTRYPYQDIDLIKSEIITNGPVAAVVFMSNEYLFYKGGIFTNENVAIISTHLIKLIGWGRGEVDGQPVDYWLVQDSQGVQFGENGYSRIKMGILGIDSHVSWAMPLL
eukprot:TRINITY_DN8268_c0_g5_i1.p1 TRINITY_DN8268_c0_g5~~TRINITY_DN8268_c0_g5_i1.p1  ORF type:complete len:330 (+),score=83.72 TRINITY_DN8268_c0_g5_i1:66-992(+)